MPAAVANKSDADQTPVESQIDATTATSQIEEEQVEEEQGEEDEEEDEDPEDPLPAIREECGEAHCTKFQEELNTCTLRVESKTNTTETCNQEFFDFIQCVDHCAAPKIFAVLK